MYLGHWRRKIDLRPVGVVFSSALGIFLAILIITHLNKRLSPILLELALTQTSNCITAAVDSEVSRQAVSYNDLVSLERSSDGSIVALTSNMAQANTLRAQLLDTALSSLDGLETMEFRIPLGTIYDWDLLSGRGPDIRIRVLYTGTGSAEFENCFYSAGINQTCHQIVFHVKTDISVLLPGRQEKTTVSTRVCVAETIIVGKVPETYLQIEH